MSAFALDQRLSRPLDAPQLRVVSLGAGVQSSALALMADEGLFGAKPDYAIFSDTGAEPAAVYAQLWWLASVLSYPVRIVSAGSLRQELLDASAGIRGAWGRPPLFVKNPDGTVGMARRQCTQDYKIEPIRKEVRRLIGLRPRQRAPKVKLVEQWIGISTDEIVRMKTDAQPFVQNRWPLIEAGFDRRRCLAWMESRGHPRPPKSACTFCPYHDDNMWRAMRGEDPDSWRDACEVDDALRSGGHIMQRGEPYLHRSCVRLADVDLSTPEDRGQLPLFPLCDPLGFANECEGMCGV